MTEKIYDYDSYLTEFSAKVLSCEKCDKGYKTELDRTLFFPEEGGQCCDIGEISGILVTYVELFGDTIYHYTDEPLPVNETVSGKIDFKLRFRNMQNHSGEHIICGIAHRLHGLSNVGFHLGDDIVTMDLDGYLAPEQLSEIEILANEAVYRNMPVTAYYPDDNELSTLDYRAKGEISENIRIVKIGDVDICACCAPHVKNTGEIGIIKILDAVKYKGGMRLSILSGMDALCDYQKKHSQNAKISSLLSAKQEETFEATSKLLSTIGELNQKLTERVNQIAEILKENLENSDKNICLKLKNMEIGDLRIVANELKDKTSAFLILLSGNDEAGYRYVIISGDNDASEFTKNANLALSGRGGGRGNMTSGTFMAKFCDIEGYFRERL
jgi:alanyl-tRNA synthetase